MRIILAVMIGCVSAALYLGPVGAAGPAGAQPGSDPSQAVLGNWLVQSHDGIIQISRAPDGTYQGRIVGGINLNRLDSRNPDPAKRQNTLKGTVIITRLKYAGDDHWSGGTIYDPSSGKHYQCNLQLLYEDVLKVRGFRGIGLFGGSQIWSRYYATQMDLSGPVP